MSAERTRFLELPEELKFQLIKKAQQTIRRKAIEAKVWRELFTVENLTINGHVVWNESHLASRSADRRRLKKRSVFSCRSFQRSS